MHLTRQPSPRISPQIAAQQSCFTLHKQKTNGFARVVRLKAFFLVVVSEAGFDLTSGHARSGRSLDLQKAFGAAQIGAAHPNWHYTNERSPLSKLALRADEPPGVLR